MRPVRARIAHTPSPDAGDRRYAGTRPIVSARARSTSAALRVFIPALGMLTAAGAEASSTDHEAAALAAPDFSQTGGTCFRIDPWACDCVRSSHDALSLDGFEAVGWKPTERAAP
jgi:hypothetical protein